MSIFWKKIEFYMYGKKMIAKQSSFCIYIYMHIRKKVLKVKPQAEVLALEHICSRVSMSSLTVLL